jgi:hypothetical protein
VKLFSRQPKTRSTGPLEDAANLEADGRNLEAIDVLTNAIRNRPDAELERELIAVRHRAFGSVHNGDVARLPADGQPVDLRLEDGIPTVGVGDLSAGLIREAIMRHGSLIVRGLIAPERAQHLVEGVDRAFAAHEVHSDGIASSEDAVWYSPFEAEGDDQATLALGREFISRGGGVWTADSPRLLFELLDTYERAGLRRTITDYLGERPVLSVNKGTLRRVRPTGGTEWWHQDGAFLGEGITSLNVWLSLTHSGRDAPGMDVVAKRIDEIVEMGTGGADFDWSVGDEVVDRVAGGSISRPVFEPGDALLFDHLCLHQTGTDPGMTQTRYAIETWFFGPSAYPDPHQQLPLVF